MIDEDGSDMQREDESPNGFGNNQASFGAGLDDERNFNAQNVQKLGPSASEE